MMLGAGGKRRRLDELERALADLRQQVAAETERRIIGERARADELAERSSSQTGEFEALHRAFRTVTERAAAQETRLGELDVGLSQAVERAGEARREQQRLAEEVREALARHGDDLERLRAADEEMDRDAGQPTAQQRQIAAIEVAVGRLARRIDLDAAEAVKTATALLERMERVAPRTIRAATLLSDHVEVRRS